MFKKYLPDLLLLITAIIWGASYSLTKGALNFTPVLLFLVIRFGITFLLLLPFTIKGTSKNPNNLDNVRFCSYIYHN